MIRDDKMTKDIRGRLKEMAGKDNTVNLIKGGAKMFLASTGEVIGNEMPTIGGMIDMNRDLLTDTMRFIRHPADAVGRGIAMAMGSEDVKALKRLGKNMMDDLKTGNLYDPNRDRTEFGERTRDLMNEFGGVDMTGFKSDGSYVDPGTQSDRNYQRDLANYQESNADKRTVATLNAIGTSTKARIAHDDVMNQQKLRISIKQHSQVMSGMGNIITQQAATVQAINSLSTALLEVSRESHQQVMDQLRQANSLLQQIAMNTTPPQAQNKPTKNNMDFMSANGSIDIRKYLRTVAKQADTKYGISSTASLMTGGMGIKGMTEMLQNNPWMAVTTVMMEKMLPEYLKQTMETAQKYMENFIPSLLTKFADRGRRFDNAAPGEKKLSDFVMGLFGITPKAGRPGVDNVLRDPNAQAVLTNRTVHAIEQVIPMWLSRIYSGITGEDVAMYNYRTGRMEKAKYTLAREAHAAHDYVGRMGSAAYSINERARGVRWKNPKHDEEFQDYVYQYLNTVAANGKTFVNPYASRKNILDTMPDGPDAYKDALVAILRSMPRSELMKISKEIQQSRMSRNASSNQTYSDLQESGLQILFSGVMDKGTQSEIMRKTKGKRYGLSDQEVDDIVSTNKAKAITNGARTIHSTNEAVNDILATLNRGIITYTYIVGKSSDYKDGKIPGFDRAMAARGKAFTVDDRILQREESRKRQKEIDEKEAYQKRQLIDQSRDRNRLLIRDGEKRSSFDDMLAQQRDLNIDLAGYYTLDNPETQAYLEKERAKANRKFVQQTFGIKNGQGSNAAPFRLMNQALETVDNAMFKFMFGEEVPEGYGDNDNQVQSFFRTIELRLKGEWEMAKDWFSENIGGPLKEFFLGDNSIIGRTVNKAKERAGEALTKFGNGIKERVMERHGDQIRALQAKGVDTGSAVANAMMDAVDKFMYGDQKEGHGKTVDENGDVQYGGFIGKLRRAGDRFQTFMFGADPEKDPNKSKQKFEFLKKELNIAAPDMIIGGGLGLLGSMLLPGGPIMGAMIGMGAGLLKGSETFQNFLFGEKMEREVVVIGSDGNPVMVRDPKTHKMVPKTKKIDSRRGGLIDGPIYDGIKNYVPKVAGGAAAGWLIGGGLLPGLAGHLIGGFAGSMVGLVASSDRLKRMLFGDEEDETGESGLFSKNMRDKVLKAIRDHGGGMILGKVAGGLTGSMVGGLLPTAIGAMVGPVLGSIGAVAGFFAGPKLMNMIFGEEAEVETTDPKTGKKIKKKERMGGMFGKIYDATRDELISPFAEKMNAAGKKVQDWFHEAIIEPLGRAMDPAKKAMHDAGEAISRSMANITESIRDSITNAIGMPLKDFMKEKVITPLSNVTSKIFGVIGKIVGGIISAPFKAMEYIFTGTVKGTSESERKKRHREAEKENRRQIRKADRDARRNKRLLQDTTGTLGDFLGPDEEMDEMFEEASEDRRETAAEAVKKENDKNRRKNDQARESHRKTKAIKNQENQEAKQDLREQIADADMARKEKRETKYGADRKGSRKATGKATGVAARAGGNNRTIGKIYDVLLDIRKDIAHIRGKIDSGVSYSGGGGNYRKRGPGLIGSILGLPFKVVGAAARGVGDVAGGVLKAGGKVVKGGVGLVGDLLTLPIKLFTTAGKILVNAVSGVASALGGIVNGLVHLASGAVGLVGHILGGALRIAGKAGVGIAKGIWNVATVVPRAAAGIIGYGAKTAGSLIGGGLKLAGSVISAPFKLLSGLLGGGKPKHPPADYKPIGPMAKGKDSGPDYSASRDKASRGPKQEAMSAIDKFGVRTSQGLALRIWSVGESDVQAEIKNDKEMKAHRAERKEDLKDEKEERKLQTKQLKAMERMDKRQHRQAMLSLFLPLISGLFRNAFGSPLGEGIRNIGFGAMDRVSQSASTGFLGKIPIVGGLFKSLFGNDENGRGIGTRMKEFTNSEYLRTRLVTFGAPEAPQILKLIQSNGIMSVPVFITGSMIGGFGPSGGPGGGPGGGFGPEPIDPDNPRVPDELALSTHVERPTFGPSAGNKQTFSDRVKEGYNKIKSKIHDWRTRRRSTSTDLSTRRRKGLRGRIDSMKDRFTRVRGRIQDFMDRQIIKNQGGGLFSRIRSGIGGIFGSIRNRFRRNGGSQYGGPAMVGELGPEMYAPGGALTGEVLDSGYPIGLNGPEIIDVGPSDVIVPNYALPMLGAGVPGYAGGYNFEDLLRMNQELLNESLNRIAPGVGSSVGGAANTVSSNMFTGRRVSKTPPPTSANTAPTGLIPTNSGLVSRHATGPIIDIEPSAVSDVVTDSDVRPRKNPFENLRAMFHNRNKMFKAGQKRARTIFDRFKRTTERVPDSVGDFVDADYEDLGTNLTVRKPSLKSRIGGWTSNLRDRLSVKSAGEGKENKLTSFKSRAVETYKKAYAKFNRILSRSKTPANTVDNLMLGAHTEEEIQAVKDVQQLDSGKGLMVLGGGGEGEKKKGFFQTIMDAFSGAGGGLKGLAAIGTSLFGGLLGPLMSALKFGGTVLGNIGGAAIGTASIGTTLLAGGIGTAKAALSGDTGHAVAYGARTATSVGSKLLAGFSKVLTGFLNSATVTKAIQKLGEKPGTIANVANKAFGKATTTAAAAGSAAKLLNKAFWPILIATAVVDFTTGMVNANEHFNISRSDVTTGMRVASGLAKAISGIAFGLLPVDWLAQTFWKIFAKSEDKERLKEQQSAYNTRVEQYNTEHGTSYSVEEFQKNVKETASGEFTDKKHPIRNALQKIGGVIGDFGKGLWGEIKNLGGMAAKALTGHPMELLNYKTQTNIKNDNWTSFLAKLINVPIKVGLLPISVITWIGKGIGKRVGDVFGGVWSTVKAMGDYWKFLLKGDLQGLIEYDPVSRMSDKNSLKPMLHVLSVGLKTLAVPGTAISWGVHKIVGAVGDMIKPLLGDQESFETDNNNMKAFVDAGDPKGLVNYQLSDKTGGIFNLINHVSKAFYTITAAINWAKDNILSKIPILGDFFDRDYELKGQNADGTLKAGYIKDEKTGNIRKMTSKEKNADKEHQAELKRQEAQQKHYEIQQKGGIRGALDTFFFGKKESPYDIDTGKGPRRLSYGRGEDLIGALSKVSPLVALMNPNSTLHKYGSSVLSGADKIASINPIYTIGKAIAKELIDRMAKDGRTKNPVASIFESIGTSFGEAMISDMKKINGRNATISDSVAMGTAAAQAETAGNGAESGDESKPGFWSRLKNKWNSLWGKGPVKAYSQRDHRWGNMAEDGCGPTAAAMVASAYGRGPANPAEANAMSYNMGMRDRDGGTNPAFFQNYASQHGFKMQSGPVSGRAMAAAAQAGHPVTVMGKGGAYGGGEHYMVLEGAYGRGKTAVLRDPLTGGRKTMPMNALVNTTDTAIYSSPSGRGARVRWGRGEEVVDSGSSTATGHRYVDGMDAKTWASAHRNEYETYEDAVNAYWDKAKASGYTPGINTSRNDAKTEEEKIKEAQAALVERMTWLSSHKIKYSQEGVQDPDKGVASCASTVGWAYRKVFGNDVAGGMSASTRTQSQDNRFVDIYRFSAANQGPPGKTFDLNKLQPGDIVYISSKVGKGHTEMYAGNGIDLSHGGGNWPNGIPEDGPNPVTLNESRQKKVFAVRRFKDLANGSIDTLSGTMGGLAAGATTDTGSDTGEIGDTGDKSILETILGIISSAGSVLFGKKPDATGDSDDSSTTTAEPPASSMTQTEWLDKHESEYPNHESAVAAYKALVEQEKSGNAAANRGRFPTYALNENQLYGIANILQHEQPGRSGMQAEASLLANLTDKNKGPEYTVGDVNALIKTATGGWFYHGRQRFNFEEGSKSQVTKDALDAARQVLISGYRTMPRYIDEHDCFSDISSVLNNGAAINKKDRSAYLSHISKVSNNMGSHYTFFEFPNDKADPFGYTSDSLRQKWGEDRYAVDYNQVQTGEGLKGNGKASLGRGTRRTTYGSGRPHFGRGTRDSVYGAPGTKSWGRGVTANLAHNAREVTNQIAAMNSSLNKARQDQQSATNVETMAKAITDAVQSTTTTSSGGNSEAILQTIATTLGSMLELMTKMADKMDSSKTEAPTTSEVNKAYAYQPPRAARYANGDIQSEDIGSSVIHRLVAAT